MNSSRNGLTAALVVFTWLAAGQEVASPPVVGTGKVVLPELPSPEPLTEAVLFGFDSGTFPFQDGVRTHLFPGQKPRIVLRPGPAGSHDEVILYYGSVIRIGDTFHMWYNGNFGPLANTIGYEREKCVICYATSKDGETWDKPNLELVEFNGSKDNNIVALDEETLWSTAAVLHDPEDPDPARRFKMAYEAYYDGYPQFCVAYSPDGLTWKRSPGNPRGVFLEAAGICKFRGLYYVTGQSGSSDNPVPTRKMVTFASADFEHWSPCGAVGLDRGPQAWGPENAADWNQFEEVHLGAGLWNRGNVILGIYGQWHGHPTGDRAWTTIDLGLAISHDALHYSEPIPGFRIVPAREQAERPAGIGPSLEQGQGMENYGDRTLYWYSLWRGTEGSGVRLVTWSKDRLGALRPFRPERPQAVSCLIEAKDGPVSVRVNASGLGEYSKLRISLLDRGFRPLAGYGDSDAAVLSDGGLTVPVGWNGGEAIRPELGPVRIRVQYEGVRPEDAQLHAIYLGGG